MDRETLLEILRDAMRFVRDEYEAKDGKDLTGIDLILRLEMAIKQLENENGNQCLS